MDARYRDLHVARRDHVCLPECQVQPHRRSPGGYVALIVIWDRDSRLRRSDDLDRRVAPRPDHGADLRRLLRSAQCQLDLRSAYEPLGPHNHLYSGGYNWIGFASLTGRVPRLLRRLRCNQLHRAVSAQKLHHFKTPGISHQWACSTARYTHGPKAGGSVLRERNNSAVQSVHPTRTPESELH